MAKRLLGVVTALVLSSMAFAQQQPASLRIYPTDVTLWGDAASQRFWCLFTGADGVEKDVTSAAALSVSDPDQR